MVSAPHLLIFTIGGVQGFIAQARRTQDLWVGSRALHVIGQSALKAAMQELASHTHEPHQMVIYPAVDKTDSVAAMPNRFIVIAPPGLEPRAFANRIHAAAINAWGALSEATLEEFAKLAPSDGDPPTWQSIWREQSGTEVDETEPRSPWIEFYWAAVTLAENWSDYRDRFRVASQLLASRKQLRDFDHLPPQPGEKCTLNGTLSALSNDPEADRFAVRQFWEAVFEKVNSSPQRSLAMLRRGERLCAPNTIKRFAQDVAGYQDDQHFGRARFPSTSTIAAAPFKLAVAQAWNANLERVFTELDTALGRAGIEPVRELGYPALQLAATPDYAQCKRFLDFDGDFVQPEGLTDEALLECLGLRESSLSRFMGRFQAIRGAFKQFRTAIPEKISPPSSYYAVLMLDGDRIGETIGGFDDPGKHRRFSEVLSGFASASAREIVEIPGQAGLHLADWAVDDVSGNDLDAIVPGRLIYCGGDDVLAMVPAASAFALADALRYSFTRLMEGASFAGMHMSAGIAIVHFTHPLESALHAARQAEKHAKQRMERDAVSVTLMRRSGETRGASLKWQYDGASALQTIDLVRRAFMQEDRLSTKLAYEALEIGELLDTENWRIKDFRNEMQAARRAEFLRLVHRHTPNKKRFSATNQELGKRLVTLAEHISLTSPEISGWSMLADWLLVARFLAKGE